MQPSAEVLVDRIASVMRQRLPAGVTPAYFDGFLRRNRPALVAVLDHQLGIHSVRIRASHRAGCDISPGDAHGDNFSTMVGDSRGGRTFKPEPSRIRPVEGNQSQDTRLVEVEAGSSRGEERVDPG